MALSIYADAIKEFETAIVEVDYYLTFTSTANQLRPWVGKLIAWEKMQLHEKEAIQQFIGQKDYHVEVGYNGLIISIGAAFEHLVRRIIREGVLWINAKCHDYSALTVPLMQQNLIRSGHALATIAEPPVEISYDYELLCRNLGTCHANGGKLQLNADAFAINITNIGPRRMDDCLSRIGIAIDWDYFGGKTQFQAHFNTKAGRKTTDEVAKYLKDFVLLRNKIAHSGVGMQVAQTEVKTAMTFFRLFAPFLAEAIEAGLKKAHR